MIIIGHERNLRYLERVLARGTLAHAYLFHGPESIGKKTVALALARTILCVKNTVALGGCGACESCRLTALSAHPDLILLSRERPLVAEDTKQEIGIRNIHELQRLLGLSGWGNGRRAVIIDGAERLSREAQSSLLKILEEPRPGTHFILISASPGALLPTIVSRSVPIGFAALPPAELAAVFLDDVPRARRKILLGLAGGRPGILARLLKEPAFLKEELAAAKRFEALMYEDLPGQFAFGDATRRDPTALIPFLRFLVRQLRQDFLLAIGSDTLHADSEAALWDKPLDPVEGGTQDERRAMSLANVLHAILERLALAESTAVNRRLIADSVFVELQALRP